MSVTTSSMQPLGSANKAWGVCGFTSTFYAVYQKKVGQRPLLNGAGVLTRVLAEIRTYITLLRAAGQVGLLNDITTFTRSFGNVPRVGDFSKFSFDGKVGEKGQGYVERINSAVNRTDAELTDGLYGLAMPPEAVRDYLKRVWNTDSEVTMINGGSSGIDDAIVGIMSPNLSQMKMYGGLCHYVYRVNGKYHSWDSEYASVMEAAMQGIGAPAFACCVIKIK